MKKSTSSTALASVLLGFFVMGFCDLVGVSVTYAKDTFHWSEIQAGFLPSMVFIWFFILSIPTAMAMDKIGRKRTVIVSMAFTILGMIIPFILFDATTCYLAFALIGIGNTILQVSLNPLLTNVVKGDKLTSSLTTGQFIKAISSFVGPIIVAFCSTVLHNWVYMFPMFAGITLLSSIWLLSVSIDEGYSEKKKIATLGQTLSLLKDRKIMYLFLGILCIVGLDVGMNTIAPKLLMERVGLAKEAAGIGSTWYFAARTLGTVLGAILLAKVSEKKYFRLNMLIDVIAIIALAFVHSQVLIVTFICIIAFASSSIFAVIYSMAIRNQPNKANEISGLMITGVAGGAIVPPLMGFATESMGGQIGGVCIIGICILYLVFCSNLRLNDSEQIK